MKIQKTSIDCELTNEDCEFILTSLEYTRMNFESVNDLPYEEKREQLNRLDTVKHKIRCIRDRNYSKP